MAGYPQALEGSAETLERQRHILALPADDAVVLGGRDLRRELGVGDVADEVQQLLGLLRRQEAGGTKASEETEVP